MLGGVVGGVSEAGYVTGLGGQNKCHQGSVDEDLGQVGRWGSKFSSLATSVRVGAAGLQWTEALVLI